MEVKLDTDDRRIIRDALIHYRGALEENGIAPLTNERHQVEYITRVLEKLRDAERKKVDAEITARRMGSRFYSNGVADL